MNLTLPDTPPRQADRNETRRPTVLWIGDVRRTEFAAAAEIAARCAELIARRDISSPDAMLPPDVVCLAQAAAGDYGDQELAELRRRFPTVPLVIVEGNWSEGEQRTGRPHAVGWRISWAGAAAALDEQLQLLAAGRCPAWGYGDTLAADERAVMETPAATTREEVEADAALLAAATILVSADDAGIAQWLVDQCRTWRVRRISCFDDHGERREAVAGPSAVLWAPPADPVAAQCRRLQLAADFPAAPVVALLSFPRPDQVATWKARGVAAAVPLPCEANLLRRTVSQTLRNVGVAATAIGGRSH